MHALIEQLDAQGAGGDAAQRRRQPQLIVVAAPRIETDDERRAADPIGEAVDVKRQVRDAGFFAGFDAQRWNSETASSIWPWAAQSGSKAGDLLGILMYSIKFGTMASPQH